MLLSKGFIEVKVAHDLQWFIFNQLRDMIFRNAELVFMDGC